MRIDEEVYAIASSMNEKIMDKDDGLTNDRNLVCLKNNGTRFSKKTSLR